MPMPLRRTIRCTVALLVAFSLLPVGRPLQANLTLESQLADLKATNETCADRGLADCPYPAEFIKTLNVPDETKQLLVAEALPVLENDPAEEPRLNCRSHETRALSKASSRVYPQQPGNLTQLKTRHKHTYLIVAVPPHWGSTGLEGLIASSPHVSNMCSAGTWACEGTWLLSRAGLFNATTRWRPNYTDWDKAFRIFQHEAWNMSLHFLMDKSPPNIAKMAELVDYFESHNKNYYFITMGRHPCFFNQAKHHNYYLKADMLRENLPFLPAERRIHLLYEEAMLAPELVTQRIIDRVPELEYLDYGVNGMSEILKEKKAEKQLRKGKQGQHARGRFRPKTRPGTADKELPADELLKLTRQRQRRQHERDQKRKEEAAALAALAGMMEVPPDQRPPRPRGKLQLHMHGAAATSAGIHAAGQASSDAPAGPAQTTAAWESAGGARRLRARESSWLEYSAGGGCYFARHSPCFDPAVAETLGYKPA